MILNSFAKCSSSCELQNKLPDESTKTRRASEILVNCENCITLTLKKKGANKRTARYYKRYASPYKSAYGRVYRALDRHMESKCCRTKELRRRGEGGRGI